MLISKIFIPNLMCVLTNERYKHIRQDFMPPGSCPKILAKVTPESTVVTLNIADDIAQKLGVDTNV